MILTVVRPAAAHSAYKIAAETFAHMAELVSGARVNIITDGEYVAKRGEHVVFIGNDAANSAVADLYLNRRIDGFGIRYGTDAYCIRTANIEGESILILAGGRPRAAIYAVYRYFELYCGCRWFWDGDRVPTCELPFEGIDLTESPRFEYRGLRYFAHRSLHRFQAEQWGLEEWKTELDWVLKKRLNLFMLRIGMDDLFQKAFPDVVTYPSRDEKLPEAGAGYDDRTLFWSLQYRGELRKKILAYAFERDLWHPEDCGTMTHWYSRTPLDYLNKVKPELLPQTSKHYNDPTGRVWDIRRGESFDNYFKLTETHVAEYGKPEIFHTIGLGERRCSTDREVNQRMKLYVYRKILSHVQEKYPNAPLLIASWDLWQQFEPEEVRSLVAELNPSQAIILDYTSDTKKYNNYKEWGVTGRFPWIFGIFSAFEPNSEIRGLYEYTNELLGEAKDDPMCRGLILWPELSHGDPFVIEYFAKNAWDSETPSVAERVDEYCRDRYPATLAGKLTDLWHRFMPIVQLDAWSTGGEYRPYGDDLFFMIPKKVEFSAENAEHYKAKVARYAPCRDAAAEILTELTDIVTDDEMTLRDILDIARTVVSRYINAAIYKAQELYVTCAPLAELHALGNSCVALMGDMIGILACHTDYSLLDSLKRLGDETEVNPNFENTLKNNAECAYCRSFIYENAEYLYLPELRVLFDTVEECIRTGKPYEMSMLTEPYAAIRDRYFATPLSEMRRDCGTLEDNLLSAAEHIRQIVL